MRCVMIFVAALTLGAMALPQPSAPQPSHLEIGRLTSFDFGPPFVFYELFLVTGDGKGASIERITLTPPNGDCVQPAAGFEIGSARTSESVMELLGTNPCTIPEKALRRKQKRSKKYARYSGAEVAMQVVCGAQTRIIRSDILDRDWFDPSTKTPENTSRTMRLLERLDGVVGPGVMDRPVLAKSQKENAAQTGKSQALTDVAEGRYDALFDKDGLKLSELYRSTQNPPPGPVVRLLISTPFQPEVFVLPQYPQMAKIAHMTGTVAFKVGIDANGGTTDITFESGEPLLQHAVKDAVRTWKFPIAASGKQVQATIDFQCAFEGK